MGGRQDGQWIANLLHVYASCAEVAARVRGVRRRDQRTGCMWINRADCAVRERRAPGGATNGRSTATIEQVVESGATPRRSPSPWSARRCARSTLPASSALRLSAPCGCLVGNDNHVVHPQYSWTGQRAGGVRTAAHEHAGQPSPRPAADPLSGELCSTEHQFDGGSVAKKQPVHVVPRDGPNRPDSLTQHEPAAPSPP